MLQNPSLLSQFRETWKSQWLPKLASAIKGSVSKSVLKQIKPLIKDIDADLDDTCGKRKMYNIELHTCLIFKVKFTDTQVYTQSCSYHYYSCAYLLYSCKSYCKSPMSLALCT